MDQPFTLAQFASACQTLTGASAADCTINTFGSARFPGHDNRLAHAAPEHSLPSYQPLDEYRAGRTVHGSIHRSLPKPLQSFRQRHLDLGRHTITFGGSFAYTQLNTRDRRNQLGMIASRVDQPVSSGQIWSTIIFTPERYFLSGNPNRYWRANETGEYIQDKFQFEVQSDHHGRLSLRLGRRPDREERQPAQFRSLEIFVRSGDRHDRFVRPDRCGKQSRTPQPASAIRLLPVGNGVLHLDRGCLELPRCSTTKWWCGPAGECITTVANSTAICHRALRRASRPGGPFGINQQVPFVATQFCPQPIPGNVCALFNLDAPNPWSNQLRLALGEIPSTIAGDPTRYNPALNPYPAEGRNLRGQGIRPFYLGVYNRNNKLPYTMNSTLDIQWQPRSDLGD